MIDITLYRARIGSFKCIVYKSFGSGDKSRLLTNRRLSFKLSLSLSLALIILTSLIGFSTLVAAENSNVKYVNNIFSDDMQNQNDVVPFSFQVWSVGNFYARYINGNIINSGKGLSMYHINIRSIQNKVSEIKRTISENKPHVLGCSECELKKSLNENQLSSLKIPGY